MMKWKCLAVKESTLPVGVIGVSLLGPGLLAEGA